MLSNIIIIPFFNFFNLSILAYKFGRRGSIYLTSVNLIILICSVVSLSKALLLNNIILLNFLLETGWLQSGIFLLQFNYLIDNIAIFMLILVSIISVIVHIYSLDYMYQEPELPRFISYLSLFTFFMFILIISQNLIQLFVGWEGVGLCSYLLISFWSQRLTAVKAALKAIIFNRVGDCSLLIGIALCFWLTGSTKFSTLFLILPYYDQTLITFYTTTYYLIDVISLFFIIAAIGKSAQFLLHPWLADAMEGPTPVSALIHAATMVTAGLYLIVRCSYFLEYTQNIYLFIYVIGMLTLLLSSISGIFQYDIKKIIAYSTCSQLGYMFITCGSSGYLPAFFHLINHGYFKALLFLTAGLLIHNLKEEQDIRKFGGLLHYFPYSYFFFFIGSLSLIGLPYLTGFYSKDFLIEYLYSQYHTIAFLSYIITTFCIFLTTVYSLRILIFTFLIKPNGYKKTYISFINSFNNNTNEALRHTLLLLIILSFFSIFIGYLTKLFFINMNLSFFNQSIFFKEHPLKLYNLFFIELDTVYIKQLPYNLMISATTLCFMNVLINKPLTLKFLLEKITYISYTFCNQAWFVNNMYYSLSQLFFYKCNLFFILDKTFIENQLLSLTKNFMVSHHKFNFMLKKRRSTSLSPLILLMIFFHLIINITISLYYIIVH